MLLDVRRRLSVPSAIVVILTGDRDRDEDRIRHRFIGNPPPVLENVAAAWSVDMPKREGKPSPVAEVVIGAPAVIVVRASVRIAPLRAVIPARMHVRNSVAPAVPGGYVIPGMAAGEPRCHKIARAAPRISWSYIVSSTATGVP